MTAWHHRQLTPDGRSFWAAWLLALLAFVVAAATAHWQYTFPLDERVGRYLYYHHHPLFMSNAFWELWRELGRERTVVILLFGLAALLAMRRELPAAVLTLGAMAMALLYAGVRHIVDRPVDSSPVNDAMRNFPLESSFPSGHAFGAALTFGLVMAFLPRLVPWRPAQLAGWLLCAVIILFAGAERLVHGNHWLSDVLGAYVLAALYVSAAWRIAASAQTAHHRSRGVAAEAAAPG
jgi:undecaprenyl-diphosphatase